MVEVPVIRPASRCAAAYPLSTNSSLADEFVADVILQVSPPLGVPLALV
jgi:hypothetical protein